MAGWLGIPLKLSVGEGASSAVVAVSLSWGQGSLCSTQRGDDCGFGVGLAATA